MAQGQLSGPFARSVSSRAPKRFQHLPAGSVKPCRPTMRAQMKWEVKEEEKGHEQDGVTQYKDNAFAHLRET